MKVLLDDVAFSKKPISTEIGRISNRIVHKEVELTIEELAKEVVKGKTFVPAILKEVDGKKKRKNENWYSQQIIALDFDKGFSLEQALNDDFFKRNAAFLYTTLNHSEEHNRFRVVFMLTEPIMRYQILVKVINKLMKLYPNADNVCKDGSRLFFGGRKLYEFDYSNRLCISDFIEDTLRGDIQSCNSNMFPQRVAQNPVKDIWDKPQYGHQYAKNINFIRTSNFDELRKLIGIDTVELRKGEIDDYLKKQDLRNVLGVYSKGSLYDIFHEEQSPSASIFQSCERNGHWLYKCHSSNHDFIGNIFEVVKKLNNYSTIDEARVFLIKLFQIKVIFDAKEDEIRKRLQQYKKLFESEKAASVYPNLFKVLNKYKLLNDIQILLNIAIENVGNYEGRALFYPSVNTISKMFNKSKSITNRQINLLVLFKLVKKVEKNDLPKELLINQKKHQKSKKYMYMSSTYEFPHYSEVLFKSIENMCKLWIANGCTSKTMSFDGILRTFGEEEAARVFPQNDKKKSTELSEEVTMKIHQVTMECIDIKGWATEKEILEGIHLYFKGQKYFKQVQFKRCISEMLEMYNLELIPTNKQIKQEMNITESNMKINSFPKIIRRISNKDINHNNKAKNEENTVVRYLDNKMRCFAPVFCIRKGEGATNYVFTHVMRILKGKYLDSNNKSILEIDTNFEEAFKDSTKSARLIEEGFNSCVELGLFKIIDDTSKCFVLTQNCFNEQLVS